MVMVYLIFALSIFFVRLLAGYDSRYQKGKYISINNTVLRIVLLDSMSIYGRTRRLKKDENKMSFCGIPFYLGIGIVLLTNIVFLIIPDIPIEPWGIETNKFIVYANTLYYCNTARDNGYRKHSTTDPWRDTADGILFQ